MIARLKATITSTIKPSVQMQMHRNCSLFVQKGLLICIKNGIMQSIMTMKLWIMYPMKLGKANADHNKSLPKKEVKSEAASRVYTKLSQLGSQGEGGIHNKFRSSNDYVTGRQTALERQDLSRTYLAHHELESIIIVILFLYF